MTHFKWYRSGKLFGIRYDFDKAGDGLPTHSHGDETAHNVIVLRGRIIFINGRRGDPQIILTPGMIFDFEWRNNHTIFAGEDDSSVLHMFLNGCPKDYNNMPASEQSGSFECRE